MHDFVSHILRQYFHATNWNEYNSYLHLTSCSSAILDFAVPTGLSLSISASPTPPFFTTYRLGALPNLRAGIGYIYASTDRKIDFGGTSKDVKLKEIIERFRIVEARSPVTLKEKEYYWLGGERFAEPQAEDGANKRGEYLVYGCMHVPSARLDALWTKRISPTWQLIVTAVSTPPKYPLNALQNAAMATSQYHSGVKSAGLSGSVERLDSSNPSLSSSATIPNTSTTSSSSSSSTTAAAAATAAQDIYGLGPPGSTNLQFTLQRDTARWFTEYSYSVDDALWGFRVLHNFGAPADTNHTPPALALQSEGVAEPFGSSSTSIGGGSSGTVVVNNESDTGEAGGGLRGRFSAGAEIFVSTVEKSAGLSTGIRFSTLPDSPLHPQPIIPPSSSSFDAAIPPTSESSAQQQQQQQQQHTISPSQPPTVITATLNPMMGHLSTAYAARMARDVVVCSRFDFNVYSYESEWTVGAEYWLRKSATPAVPVPVASVASRNDEIAASAPASILSLREPSEPVRNSLEPANSAQGLLRPPTASAPPPPPPPPPSPGSSAVSNLLSPITGVLKARISTTSDIRLLWQGRLSHCLVSLGVKADLSPTHNRTAAAATVNASSGGSGGGGSAAQTGKMGIVKSIGLEVMYFSQAEDQLD